VSAFAETRPEREKVVYADDANLRYWEYVYHEDSGKWLLDEFVEGPLPDVPELAVRSRPGE
jgi:hypothetical protein